MAEDRIEFHHVELVVTQAGTTTRIPALDVVRILYCRMEDEVAQGDEEFHILICHQRFVLIGPFAAGGLSTISNLRAARPDIPTAIAKVQSLTRKLRKPGALGLRLFPVPGVGVFPISDLPTLAVEGNTDE